MCNYEMYKDVKSLQQTLYSVLGSKGVFPTRGCYEHVSVQYEYVPQPKARSNRSDADSLNFSQLLRDDENDAEDSPASENESEGQGAKS